MKTVSALWPKQFSEAKKIQRKLRGRILITPLAVKPRFIAGVDAAFYGDRVLGAACLCEYPAMKAVECTYAVSRCAFPYIPGYLSFREGPVLMKALRKLKIKPDILLFDGQGIAHPEGMGIAAHIGVLTDIPSIGCAKSRLVGTYKEPGKRKGSYSCLEFRGKTVGSVLRTRYSVRPVFVSPGHLIDVQGAVDIVLTSLTRYRIPEPLRLAHMFSKKMTRNRQDVYREVREDT